MSDKLTKFFDLIFAHASPNESVTLFTLPQDPSAYKLSEHLPINSEILARRAEAIDQNAPQGVFFGPSTRRAGLSMYDRGGLDDCRTLQTLFLDIDIAHSTHAAQNLPQDLPTAMALLQGLPDPSIIVWTGGGLHTYWLLDRALSGDFNHLQLNKALLDRVKKNANERNLHIDNVANADRVLRVPTTFNRKDPHAPRACDFLELSERRFEVAHFEALLGVKAFAPSSDSALCPPSDRGVPHSSPISPHGVESLEGGEEDALLSNVIPISAEVARERVRLGLTRVHSDRTKDLARDILHGRPLKKGQRDTDLMRAVGLVAAMAPDGCRPQDVVEVLYPTIDATMAEGDDPRNPPPDHDTALEKLTRSMRDMRKKRAEQKRGQAAMLKALIKSARASATPHEDLANVPDRPYTEDELRQFEAEHGSPIQWIVQRDGAHYIFVNGKYIGPVGTQDLPVYFKEALAPAPLETTTFENNRVRPLRASEILEKYSTMAHTVTADLRIEHSYYDAREKTFFEACARRRPILPKFNQDIQTWLEIMGGSYKDQLLDWVACVTRLDRYCAALYLSKHKGTGKTLLANGLARIWGSTPTRLANIVGSFNTDIARCPLIFADEYLPPTWTKSDHASGELRELVGSNSRTLTRKHLPNVELLGAVRVILAANDKTMLPLNESLGSADIDAIGSRFLHIPTPTDAAQYLRSLGGQTGKMSGWVDNNEIAAHALWLRDNRQVNSTGRFIVEGDPNEIRNRLITGTRIGSLVCEVIVRILMQPSRGGPIAVRAGNGSLLVSTGGIAEFWESMIKSDKVESTQKIGKQLAVMAHNRITRVNGTPFHDVDPDFVIYWSRQNLVGDPEAIIKKISQEVAAPPQPTAQVIPIS